MDTYDKLKQLDFERDDELAMELLQANSLLEPILFRYNYMGSYYVVCRYGQLYGLELVGGSNSPMRRERLDRYKQLNPDNMILMSLDDIIELATLTVENQ